MSLLRRGPGSPTDAGDADGSGVVDDGQARNATRRRPLAQPDDRRPRNATRRRPAEQSEQAEPAEKVVSTNEGPQTERQQKAAVRAVRLDRVRQARTATRAMVSPEPQRGLYVSAFLIALGVFSYLSKDSVEETKKVLGKAKKLTSVTVAVPETHPETAIILIVLALGAGATIYWRRRIVTGVSFMLAAAIGVGTPFPKNLSDLTFAGFLIPAGYVLWMLIFRMNKEQKTWLTANFPAGEGNGASRNARGQQSQRKQTGGARSRKGNDVATVTVTGRPLPAGNGRYTPPRAKSRPAQRKS